MNRYTPDNSAIIDANGKEWPVETPHMLPLPEGIARAYESDFYDIVFGGRDSKAKWYGHQENDTHWLARRPLPEVPRVKTQEELDEELDEEWIKSEVERFWATGAPGLMICLRAAIAYARKGAK